MTDKKLKITENPKKNNNKKIKEYWKDFAVIWANNYMCILIAPLLL
jgi:hypothetical protein